MSNKICMITEADHQRFEASDNMVASMVYVDDAIVMAGYAGVRLKEYKKLTTLPTRNPSMYVWGEPLKYYMPVPAGPYVRQGIFDISCRQLAIALCGGMARDGLWIYPGSEVPALCHIVTLYECRAPGFVHALYEYLECFFETASVSDEVRERFNYLMGMAQEAGVMRDIAAHLDSRGNKYIYRSVKKSPKADE